MTTPLRFVLSLALLPASMLLSSPVEATEPVEDFTGEVASEGGAVYGRLRHVEGNPTLLRGDVRLDELVPNEPVAPGDVLTTRDGRLEIQLADGTILRLNDATEVILNTLPDGSGRFEHSTILQLAAGSLIVHADGLEDPEKRFQIDTDDASIFLLSDGMFRVDVEPGLTVVKSRRGAAEIMAQDTSVMLRSGERVAVRGGEMPGEPRAINTRVGDDFDAWSASLDPEFERQDDAVYPESADLPEPVRPYVTELSHHGTWQQYPDYGWAWRPIGVAATWQPYGYGRWAWSPAGMIWVSYDRWGWAPYHYGRWEFAYGTGWLWIPGYTFAGAHVAWSVAPGYFGWCPLGYYNYPVRYGVHVGYHHNPWVYVRADHIYARHLHTVAVRDARIVKSIERNAVVVRGQPRIHPRRAASGPAFSEELHKKFRARPDLQFRGPQGERQVSFRDQEQQAGRRPSMASAPRPRQGSNPGNSTPLLTNGRPERPAILSRGQQAAAPRQRRPLEEGAATPSRPRQTVSRQPGRQAPQGQPPVIRESRPQAQGSPARPNRAAVESTPRRQNPVVLRSAPRPPQAQGQNPPRQARSGSSAERVIPRIIPRQQPRSTTRIVAPPSASAPAPRSAPVPRASSSPRPSGGNGKAASHVRGQKGGGADRGKKKD